MLDPRVISARPFGDVADVEMEPKQGGESVWVSLSKGVEFAGSYEVPTKAPCEIRNRRIRVSEFQIAGQVDDQDIMRRRLDCPFIDVVVIGEEQGRNLAVRSIGNDALGEPLAVAKLRASVVEVVEPVEVVVDVDPCETRWRAVTMLEWRIPVQIQIHGSGTYAIFAEWSNQLQSDSLSFVGRPHVRFREIAEPAEPGEPAAPLHGKQQRAVGRSSVASPTGREQLLVKSSHGEDELRVWVVKPGDEWRARLDFGDLSAETKVYERYSRDMLRLDSFFAALAQDWRGWEGDREWEALGLRLAARHDGLGHVTLDAVLEQDYAAAKRWRVRASLTLDAGALDRLVAAARSLDPT